MCLEGRFFPTQTLFLQVFGPKGMVSAGNERPFPMTTSTAQGETRPPVYHSFPSRYHQGYIRELDHFCDVIQGETGHLEGERGTERIRQGASSG